MEKVAGSTPACSTTCESRARATFVAGAFLFKKDLTVGARKHSMYREDTQLRGPPGGQGGTTLWRIGET